MVHSKLISTFSTRRLDDEGCSAVSSIVAIGCGLAMRPWVYPRDKPGIPPKNDLSLPGKPSISGACHLWTRHSSILKIHENTSNHSSGIVQLTSDHQQRPWKVPLRSAPSWELDVEGEAAPTRREHVPREVQQSFKPNLSQRSLGEHLAWKLPWIPWVPKTHQIL